MKLDTLPWTGMLVFAAACLAPLTLRAQDGYEIQVYGSETMPEGSTMLELHSNFTVSGNRLVMGTVLPSHHAMHETIEVTHGFTPWFETGFYLFTSFQPGLGWTWVGDHIRPRVRVPEEWQLPVGLSLSTEIGYQRRSFSEDTWNWELRPIIDKEFGPVYVAFNPVFEKSISGANAAGGFDFALNAKISVELIPLINLGVEYYGSLGPVTRIDPGSQQQHQIFPVVDLNISSEWEINFGVGIGLTPATDDLVIKFIFGRRF